MTDKKHIPGELPTLNEIITPELRWRLRKYELHPHK